MIFANNENGEKIEAEPKALGFCPSCEERLLAKCGKLKIWHWSHIGKKDCDAWYEPETEWHSGWKRLFGKNNCEIVMPPHRADILGNFNVVIELQHSSISIQEIAEREQFYKKMIWLVDAHEIADSLVFYTNPKEKVRKTWLKGGIKWIIPECDYFLHWKYMRKCWLPMYGAQMPVMLDLSSTIKNIWNSMSVKNSLFWLQEFYLRSDFNTRPFGIGGRFITKQRILDRYKPRTTE